MIEKFVKEFVKELIPPIIMRLYIKCTGSKSYLFRGRYNSWEDVLNQTTTYEAPNILEKVKEATMQVKTGKACYERDSVLFYKKEYSYPLISMLLYIACANDSKLVLVDFGGALGSSYYQNYPLLSQVVKKISWNIVEQEHFVKCGRSDFEDEKLRFYYDLQECIQQEKPSTIILSSVLAYLEKPFDFLKGIIDSKIEFIIMDRMIFINEPEHIITLQKVNPSIYEATYPVWLFNEEKIINQLNEQYDIILEFEDEIDKGIISEFSTYGKGFLLRRKD